MSLNDVKKKKKTYSSTILNTRYDKYKLLYRVSIQKLVEFVLILLP